MLEYKYEEWSYITLPNKMYELVKNTGDMNKQRTGYYTDAESEMLTILEYLNHGEKTNITEAMIEQIDKAIRESVDVGLQKDTDDKVSNYTTGKFISTFLELVKQKISAIYYNGYDYEIITYNGEQKESAYRNTLLEGREYLKKNDFNVRIPKSIGDPDNLVEVWI